MENKGERKKLNGGKLEHQSKRSLANKTRLIMSGAYRLTQWTCLLDFCR
ncbi:UNVERIFIED_ORG: hypothetical protein ABRZ91_001858 [Heyndrickxia coagulans]